MLTGSTRLQDLAVRSILVFNDAPGGNEFGTLYRMGMEFTCKFNKVCLHAAVLPPTVAQASSIMCYAAGTAPHRGPAQLTA
eukprot:scaffold100853_cov21-Tisochrysis_lutea.AAC.1